MKKIIINRQWLSAIVMAFLMLFSWDNMFAQQDYVTIGSVTGNTGASSVSPVNPNTRNFRYQVLYTAAEIQAAGGVAGNISRLAWNVQQGNFTAMTGYTIKMGHTTASSLGSHNTNATTQVYSASYTASSTGFTDLNFSTPFNWNGTSNIVVEVCYSRASTSTSGGSVYTTSGTSPTNRYISNTSTTPSPVCTTNTNYSNFDTKPQVRFYMTVPAPCGATPTNLSNTAVTGTTASFSWTAGSPSVGYNYAVTTSATAPVSGTNATGTSINITTGLSAGTSYYFWIRNRCTSSTNSAWVSIPFTTTCQAPTITAQGGTGCGSVTLSASASAGTVYWWDANTGGNLLGTGNNYTTSTSGTYYASAGQTMTGNNTAQLGAGANVSTIASENPFHAANLYKGQASNYLIRASELLASGISAGYITSIALDVVSVGGALNTFSIRMGNTSVNNLSGGFALSGLSYVYSNLSGVTYQPTAGINTFNLSGNGFYWDGSSNISIMFYWQNTATVASSTVRYDNMSYASSAYQTFISSWGSVNSANYRPKLLINGKGLCMSNRVSAVANVETGSLNTYYVDSDGDGYGNPNITTTSCSTTPPAGYVANNSDCDDNNPDIWRTGSFYVDADGDGYTVGGLQIICYGAEVPTGYTATSSGEDCDDTDAEKNISATYFRDADGDGFGNPSVTIVACAGNIPVGYVDNNLDCDDSLILYEDLDGDGYGSNIVVACGGVSVSGDCDDSRADVNPGAEDVCYDGLDNDCNGIIDNECEPILTDVQPVQCDITIDAVNGYVYAGIVPGAQGYRFRVKDLETGEIQFIDKVLRAFRFTDMTNYAFDHEYEVSVSVRYNNVWQPFYGNSCVIRTPIVYTQIQASQCSSTLNAMADILYADIVQFATGYRFRVTDLLNPSNVQEFNRAIRDFRMSLFANPMFSRTYGVEVAVRNRDGSYLPYGPVCTITTPTFPTTSMNETYCDNYVVSSNTEVLYADIYPGVTKYIFKLENITLGYEQSVERALRTVTLNHFSGLLPGTTYTIRVAIVLNGVEGPFGKPCSIITPGGVDYMKSNSDLLSDFGVVAYPNPFTDGFSLDVHSNSTTPVSVAVYDMTGRLLDTANLSVEDLSTHTIGIKYPAGVYNLVVSQGDSVKTVRVIKQ